MVVKFSDISTENVISREQVSLRGVRTTKTKVTVSNNAFNANCCSFIKNNFNSLYNGSERVSSCQNVIFQVAEGNVPTKFREYKYLRSYLKFLNGLYKGFNFKYLGKGKVNPSMVKKYGELNVEGTILIGMEMLYYGEGEEVNPRVESKMRLAGLSFIRFLHFGRYWIYLENIMRLRERKELKSLNNLEILQLASYADHYHSKGGSHDLYYYKSPVLSQNFCYMIEKDMKNVLQSLSDGHSLNTAFCSTVHKYDLIYCKKLYREGEYLKLYKLLSEMVINSTTFKGMTVVTDKKKFKFEAIHRDLSSGVYIGATVKNPIPYNK